MEQSFHWVGGDEWLAASFMCLRSKATVRLFATQAASLRRTNCGTEERLGSL